METCIALALLNPEKFYTTGEFAKICGFESQTPKYKRLNASILGAMTRTTAALRKPEHFRVLKTTTRKYGKRVPRTVEAWSGERFRTIVGTRALLKGQMILDLYEDLRRLHELTNAGYNPTYPPIDPEIIASALREFSDLDLASLVENIRSHTCAIKQQRIVSQQLPLIFGLKAKRLPHRPQKPRSLFNPQRLPRTAWWPILLGTSVTLWFCWPRRPTPEPPRRGLHTQDQSNTIPYTTQPDSAKANYESIPIDRNRLEKEIDQIVLNQILGMPVDPKVLIQLRQSINGDSDLTARLEKALKTPCFICPLEKPKPKPKENQSEKKKNKPLQ